MEEEKKDTMPNLTFGDEEVKTSAEETEETIAEDLNMNLKIDDSMLSDEEKQAVEEFSNKIDIKNTKAIMEYGAGTQKKMAEFSDTTLNAARTKDTGAIGELLAQLTTEVKGLNDAAETKGFLGLFKKQAAKLSTMKARFEKAEVNVAGIANTLENHQVTLLKDVATMDKMYELNLDSYKEMTMYILAGKKKLEELEEGELAELKKAAEESGKPEDAQAAKDLYDQCQRFAKKLYDLEISRSIAMQTAPQIRTMQSADTQLAEKIQSVIVNTIPLWKNQMVIALSLAHTQEAIKAEEAVTDATNELLKENAEQLHIAATATAKANQRGLVDLETLKSTNQKLLDTLDEVLQIEKEGREKRAMAEVELLKMENQLKDKLLEIGTKTE